MSFIVALIIGGVVGWLASIVMKTNAQMGMVANVAVGMVGSLLGSIVASALGISAAGGLLGFVISLLGAVALIFILQKLGLFKKT